MENEPVLTPAPTAAATGVPTLPSPSPTPIPTPTPMEQASADPGTPLAPPSAHEQPVPVAFAIPSLATRATLGAGGPRASRSTPRTGRRTWPIVVLLAAVATAAAAVVFVLASGDSSSEDPAPDTPATVETPAEAPSGEGTNDSPLVAPINDAEDVVDQINDNGAEEELLGELGLDPAGNSLPTED